MLSIQTLQQATEPPRLIAPVVPENVPLRCSYDTTAQVYRCDYGSWFEKPATHTIIMVGIFGLGFLLAAFPPVQELLKTARSVVP